MQLVHLCFYFRSTDFFNKNNIQIYYIFINPSDNPKREPCVVFNMAYLLILTPKYDITLQSIGSLGSEIYV